MLPTPSRTVRDPPQLRLCPSSRLPVTSAQVATTSRHPGMPEEQGQHPRVPMGNATAPMTIAMACMVGCGPALEALCKVGGASIPPKLLLEGVLVRRREKQLLQILTNWNDAGEVVSIRRQVCFMDVPLDYDTHCIGVVRTQTRNVPERCL